MATTNKRREPLLLAFFQALWHPRRMTLEDQIDISQFYESLDNVQQHVDALHACLSRFEAGPNSRLVGKLTSSVMRGTLDRLDNEMNHIQELRAEAAPRLERRVTAAMRRELTEAQEFLEKVTPIHRRIHEDARKKEYRKSDHRIVAMVTGEIKLILSRLEEQMKPFNEPRKK